MRRAGAILAGLALLVSGCGSSGKPKLTVFAAASLRKALMSYAARFGQAGVRFSFAGSDMLAAQIEQGVRPDVFASANTELPEELYAKHLVGKPVVFASNKLVLAVPAGSEEITRFADARRPGVTLAVGSATVPIGQYTATVLDRLYPRARVQLFSNVADREPDVTGIVGKLVEGAVDGGFLYATDVAATDGKLRAIELPASLQPTVAYAAAALAGGGHAAQARAFIQGLLRESGRQALRAAGFLPPPSR
ncbi:MAG TPA: molybdate ABC transporter substrate-binding protein [Solirubrobacteraceae bacterium]|nr:molybdate ABC transporter substrate-binding protein [Solirubrobacteraceae bacterium]